MSCKALIDTGSQVTTMSAAVAKSCGCKIKDLDSIITVKVAGGTELPYLGYTEVSLDLAPDSGVLVDTLALVIDDDKCDSDVPVVVGTNALRMVCAPLPANVSVSHPVRHAISLMVQNVSESFVGYVRACSTYVLPPKSKVMVQGMAQTNTKFPKLNVVTEESTAHQLPGGVLVSQCLISVGKNVSNVCIELVNVSDRERSIQSGSIVCALQTAEVESLPCTSFSDKDEDWLSKFHWPEDPAHAQAIRDLVLEYRDVFSTHSLDYGQTNLVEHRIDFKDENVSPIKLRYRRIPPCMVDEVRQYLDELIEAKQIRPSMSPWSFPLVLVRKKDGSIRLCIDYRRLNTLCKRDSFSLPRLDETMDALIGAKYFSKLDLKSGYYQIPMHESHKERTAFSAGSLGFYEWNSMPMGTVNATSTFQRLMQQCLGSMHLKECVVFLDDILVYSPTFESHLKRLKGVFQRLRDCGLKLKPSKCEFLKSHVQYLGHVVSEDGISTDPEKIDKVKNWSVPRNAKELSSFLGFASFYRRFVKGFSTIARPLQDVLKEADRKGNIQWSQQADNAFNELKTKLTTAPILAFADYTKPFVLHIDASGTGLGAVLYQKQDGKLKVISYASRGLNPAEKNYPAHKREFLALKWAIVDKFHDYLYMNYCEIYTDSNPLTYVLSSSKLDATGHRWLAHLSSYDFALFYKPGIKHKDADALSRLDHHETSAVCQSARAENGCCFMLPLGPDVQQDIVGTQVQSQVFGGDVASCQGEDDVLRKVISYLTGDVTISKSALKQESPDVQKLINQREKLILKDGVLYRKIVDDGNDVLQCVIPFKQRKAVFQSLHDDMGHPGRDKTLALHRARCYWPSMAKDVEEMVQKCRRCVCRKARYAPAPLVPIITSQPLELVCMDYLLVEPSSGYEHLLVITDHFTKFAKVIPTKNETALTTARALYQNFISVYGIPTRILSDQGRNFESKVIRELCALTGTAKSRTTPYHAMANGACEKMNQTLLKMLGTLSKDKKTKWKEYLPSLVYAYNCTPHETTGYSPYELMFGRKPTLPIDVEFSNVNEGKSSISKFVSDLQEHIKYSQESARKRLEQKAATAKENYDRRTIAAGLQPGDTVLVKKTVFSGREKLADKWEDDIHVVISQPNPELPVFKIKPVSRPGRVRTLHRNLLLPVANDDEADKSPRVESATHKEKSSTKRSNVKDKSRSSPSESESTDSEYELFVAPPRRQLRSHATESVTSEQQDAQMVDNLPPDSSPNQSIQTTDPPAAQSAAPVPPRRSGRSTKLPQRFGDYVMY